MAKVIAIAATKGGTAKSTTAGAISQAAIYADKRKVLCVDLDGQSNLSMWFDADLTRPGSYDLLTGKCTAADAIQHTESGVDIIAGRAALSTIRTAPGSARRLEKAIAPIAADYDLIVIDTPPSTGELQNNALFAADSLLIPLEADTNSLQALYQITDITQHIQQSNQRLQICGVIVTKYDSRPKINRYLHDAIKENAEAAGISFLMAIRKAIAIPEAMAMQEPLYQYAPKSKPAADYLALYKLIV